MAKHTHGAAIASPLKSLKEWGVWPDTSTNGNPITAKCMLAGIMDSRPYEYRDVLVVSARMCWPKALRVTLCETSTTTFAGSMAGFFSTRAKTMLTRSLALLVVIPAQLCPPSDQGLCASGMPLSSLNLMWVLYQPLAWSCSSCRAFLLVSKGT